VGEHIFRAPRWSQPYIVGLRQVCLTPISANAIANANEASSTTNELSSKIAIKEEDVTVSTTAKTAVDGVENLLTIERKR
jgi:hypothetical protein